MSVKKTTNGIGSIPEIAHANIMVIIGKGAAPDTVFMSLADAEALGAVLTDEDRARGYWTNQK